MSNFETASRKMDEIGESVEAFKAKHATALDEVSGRVDEMELQWKRELRGDRTDMTGEAKAGVETKSMGKWLRGKEMEPTERKALSISADGQDVTVRDDWDNALLRRMYDTSPMRQVARTITTNSNQLATLFTTSEFGAEWVAGDGTTTSGTTDDYPYRQTIPIYELAAQVTVTNDLLDDSAGSSGFSVEDFVMAEISNKMSRTENSAFVNGDASTKPKGFLQYGGTLTASWTFPATPATWTLRKTATGVAGDFAAAPAGADAIIDLIASLPTAYRGNARFMMSKTTEAEVRKLKDSNGASVWTPSISAGMPAQLFGYPVLLAEDMPALATGSFSIAFGDFGTYGIAQRQGTRLIRDPYTAKGSTVFHVTRRVGGGLLSPDGIGVLAFEV